MQSSIHAGTHADLGNSDQTHVKSLVLANPLAGTSIVAHTQKEDLEAVVCSGPKEPLPIWVESAQQRELAKPVGGG